MQLCGCGKEVWSKGMCNSCYGKEWYKNNKEKVKARKDQYYKDNRDKEIQRALKWNKENKEKAAEAHKQWSKRSKYYTKKYQNDVQYRLTTILRNRLCSALKHHFKTGKTLELLGCSVEDFRQYIEQQWQPGMSWENHSLKGWHIDHIKPLSSFDLSNPEELKKAAHYSNLQPLWAVDNLNKRDDFV